MATAEAQMRSILEPGAVITQRDWPRTSVRSVHVICIGGAGMSAVARLACDAGLQVSGSDSQHGQFIDPLREAGARITIGFAAENLPADTDLVIVSTAVRPDNPEVIAARDAGIPVIHRAAALAGLLSGYRLIAVAGTHGKTSTTGMCAMALRGADLDPAWAVGAAVPDLTFNAGFSADPQRLPRLGGAVRLGSFDDHVAERSVPGGADESERPVGVVEADESDGSLVAFAPQVAVVTNREPDHLDFHGDEATLNAAFDAFADRVVPGGTLVVCADDPGAAEAGARAADRGMQVVSYGTTTLPSAQQHWVITTEHPEATGTTAIVRTPTGEITLPLRVGGHHNVLNATGALAAASAAVPTADPSDLAAGIAQFRGASRRWDVAATIGTITVVDDYAHHPREVLATVEAAQQIVQAAGRGRVLVAFQPHLYSRTRVFAHEFADALARADHGWVLPVYGAREDPDPHVSALTITTQAPATAQLMALGADSELPHVLADAAEPHDLIVMMGAGDIVDLTATVVQELRARAGENAE